MMCPLCPADGRHVHPRLHVLLGEDVPRAAAAGRARAPQHGARRVALGARLHRAHLRRQGRCVHCTVTHTRLLGLEST